MLVLCSTRFSYQCLTGLRPPVQDDNLENYATTSVVPMKSRLIAKRIIQSYLTETKNEKAFYVGLQIISAFVKSNKRHFKNYSKVADKGYESEHGAINDPKINKAIGPELMKLCLEYNTFVRLMTTLQT